HQRPVSVIVLEEGDQRSGNRYELFRADIQKVEFGRLGKLELSGLSGPGAFLDDMALFVDFDGRLADRVPVFFPRGKIKRVRLVLGLLLTGAAELLVRAINLL